MPNFVESKGLLNKKKACGTAPAGTSTTLEAQSFTWIFFCSLRVFWGRNAEQKSEKNHGSVESSKPHVVSAWKCFFGKIKRKRKKKERLQLQIPYTIPIPYHTIPYHTPFSISKKMVKRKHTKWHQAGHEECTFHWQHAQCTKLQQDQADDLFELEGCGRGKITEGGSPVKP